MQDENHKYALITGGSTGIGRAIAVELAERRIPLLLVALEEPVLYETADRLRQTHGIPVHTLGIDLTREDSPQEVYDWCRQEGYSVNILINNAGFGRGGHMHDFKLSEYHQMLALNNRATVGLTYLFLPELQKHPEAFILIMSSMEASVPLPYKAVYAGTKNFLYGYGLALSAELARSGVSVTIICPGPTVTNESGMKRINAQRNAKLLIKMPDEVARIGVKAMFRKKLIIVPGRLQYFLFKLGRFFPARLKMKLLERLTHNFVNDPG